MALRGNVATNYGVSGAEVQVLNITGKGMLKSISVHGDSSYSYAQFYVAIDGAAAVPYRLEFNATRANQDPVAALTYAVGTDLFSTLFETATVGGTSTSNDYSAIAKIFNIPFNTSLVVSCKYSNVIIMSYILEV